MLPARNPSRNICGERYFRRQRPPHQRKARAYLINAMRGPRGLQSRCNSCLVPTGVNSNRLISNDGDVAERLKSAVC